MTSSTGDGSPADEETYEQRRLRERDEADEQRRRDSKEADDRRRINSESP